MTQATNPRIVVTERGGPDVLQLLQEPIPVPGPGEARLQTGAAGVSAFDVMLRSRSFPGFRSQEGVPLLEAARAHEVIENGRYAGKVVLTTGSR